MMTTLRQAFAGIGLALLAFALPGRGSAQLMPAWYVVASGGGSATISFKGTPWECRYDSAVISYTVGETCIAFDHTEKFDVTEGFQQPDGYGIKPYPIIDAIENLLFYPNPCHQFGIVRFQLNESFTTLNIKVFSMDGKCVYTDSFQSGDGPVNYQLPTDNFAPGMYIVEIVGFTNKRYMGKLIVIPQ